MQPSHPEPLVASSHVMQATCSCNKSRVLLQVVPVTLYEPCTCGYDQLNTHPPLDPGSTCSLIRADIADQLHLDGPPTSLDLFGISKSLRILTQSESHLTLVLIMNTRYLVENALVAEK